MTSQANGEEASPGWCSACVKLSIALILLFAGERSFAAEKHWNTTGSITWTLSSNWNSSGIPGASDWLNFVTTDPAPGSGMQINFANTTPSGLFEIQTINFGLTTNNNVGASTATAGNLRLDGPGTGNSFTSLISVTSTGNFGIEPTQGGTGPLTLQLNASGTFSTASTGGLYITADISETGGARNLTIAGTTSKPGAVNPTNYGSRTGSYDGAIVLAGSGSFTGTTTVSTGYLNLGNVAAVGNSSGVTVSSGGQLQLGVAAGGTYNIGAGTLTLNGSGPALAAAVGALTIGNNVTSGTTHTVGNSISLATDSLVNARGSTNKLVLTGDISGNGGLSKIGAGTLQVGGIGSYAGSTTILSGPLQLITGNDRLPTGTVVSIGQSGGAGLGTLDLNGRNQQVAGLNSITGTNATTSNNTVTSSAAAVLTLGGSGSYSFGDGTDANSGVISGSIAVNKIGTGTQFFGDANTYTGGTTLAGGVLSFTTGGVGTSGSITFSGGTLQYGTSNTSDLSSRIASSTSAISIDTGSNSVTFSTALASTNTGGLTKLGGGTLKLSTASNAYTGQTTVSAGTLNLAPTSGTNNIASSTKIVVSSGATLNVTNVGGTNANAFALANGQTLAGKGTVTGKVTIGTGGTIAPGTSVGNLTTGNEAWNSGGTYEWEFDPTLAGTGTAGNDWDLLTLSTLVAGATSGSPFNIKIVRVGNSPATHVPAYTTMKIAHGSGSKIVSFDPSIFALNDLGAGGQTWKILQTGSDGNFDISLQTAPEPTTWMLFATGLGGIFFLRRRRFGFPLAIVGRMTSGIIYL